MGDQRVMLSGEFVLGSVVPGTHYRTVSVLGTGGMGTIYEVEHTELGKRFVLKALLPELARRVDLAQRLRLEWKALAKLEHPNIVAVTDAGTATNGVPFFVMERLEGQTLAHRLETKRGLLPTEALIIMAQVLDGLSAAHAIGIVHRDIKPPNIFLTHAGGVKVLDFGIAKVLEFKGPALTAGGVAVGTPRYMAPEQARGESVDPRSDIYSAGVVLFEMLTGSGPFGDFRDPTEYLLAHLSRPVPVLRDRIPALPVSLSDLVTQMLAKDSAERPSQAQVLSGVLRKMAAQLKQVPAASALELSSAPTVLNVSDPSRAKSSDASRSREPSAGGAKIIRAAAVTDERSGGWNRASSNPMSLERTVREISDVPLAPFPLVGKAPPKRAVRQTPVPALMGVETRTRLADSSPQRLPSRSTPPPVVPEQRVHQDAWRPLPWILGIASLCIGGGFLALVWKFRPDTKIVKAEIPTVQTSLGSQGSAQDAAVQAVEVQPPLSDDDAGRQVEDAGLPEVKPAGMISNSLTAGDEQELKGPENVGNLGNVKKKRRMQVRVSPLSQQGEDRDGVFPVRGTGVSEPTVKPVPQPSSRGEFDCRRDPNVSNSELPSSGLE